MRFGTNIRMQSAMLTLAVLLIPKIVKFLTKFSDQRERIEDNRAVARIGWRPCRPVSMAPKPFPDNYYFAVVFTPLTTFGNGSPRKAIPTVFTTLSRNFRTACALHEAMCELIITLSSLTSSP